MVDDATKRQIAYPVELLRPQEYLHHPMTDSPQHTEQVNRTNQTARHLIQLAHKHFQAVNARDFSPTSPVWQDKAPWWRAEIGILGDQKMNLVEYVEQWKTLASEHPSYAITLTGPTMYDAANIVVDTRAGTAELYVSGEVNGMPEGLARSFVGIVSFKKIEGTWVSTKFRTMHGGADS